MAGYEALARGLATDPGRLAEAARHFPDAVCTTDYGPVLADPQLDAVVIAASALLGLQILSFFGISLASFQVGGGMLLLGSALAMLNAQPAEARATAGEMTDAESRSSGGASIAVVPLAIPLLTGPATMSTVVIYADKARSLLQLGALVGYGLVIALVTALCLRLAGPIGRALGQTGINVMTRLMGLILAALAVEVMADGLQSLFPLLASKGGR